MAEEEEKGQKPGDMSDAFHEVLDMLQKAPPPEPAGDAADMDAVVERLEEALDKLNEQMDQVYKATGMSREELEAYAADQKNFSEEEWSLLGQIRGELDKFREQAEATLSDLPEAAEAGSGPTKKKGQRKRRKDWLQS